MPSLILSWTMKGPKHNAETGVEDLTDHWRVYGPHEEAECRAEYERLIADPRLWAAVISTAVRSTEHYAVALT